MYRPFSYSKHQNVDTPGYYHRGYEGYKLPSYAMTAHKNPYPPDPKKWPEDIECVMPSSDPQKGAIYISNVEAAENILTLNSTVNDILRAQHQGSDDMRSRVRAKYPKG